MNIEDMQQGDAVYAAVTIANDGSVPEAAENEIFAHPGTLGMLINTGHLEEDPGQMLYLVSFENDNGELGPPITCLPEELSTAPQE
jgi:nitrogen fixation protein NifZ